MLILAIQNKTSPRRWKIWLLIALVLIGFVTLFYYVSWWLQYDRLTSPLHLLLLLAALFYIATQMIGIWILCLAARRTPRPPLPSTKMTVDVFVTACGEPHELIESCLTAAVSMRYEHRTWLLDDCSDPGLQLLATSCGAGYLSRAHTTDAKAGNLNAALPGTDGDIIVIFDIDHVPAPDFLEHTLGHFEDPQVGFVQVMLTFNNSDESWVARSAMETSLEYYNPTSLGSDAIGGATLMGSNALIRRRALQSIGGYQPGLAEDLATSLALHGAGWKSAYVAKPLAPGIAPPGFTAWFVQQLKWARGVFELLITAYPRLFPRLTWGQRLSYITRMTRYWIGPVIGFHLITTIAVLIFADRPLRDGFHQYLTYIAPLVLCDMAIRQLALNIWRHEATPKTTLAGAITLVYATWPIYLLAWIMAVFRRPLAFMATPKSRSQNLSAKWLLPQILTILLLLGGIFYTVIIGDHPPSFLLMAAAVQALLQLLLLYRWLYSETAIAAYPLALSDRRQQKRYAKLKDRQYTGMH